MTTLDTPCKVNNKYSIRSVKFRYLLLGRLYFLLAVYDGQRPLHVGNVLLDPLERVLLGVGPVGGVRPGVPSSALLHAVPGVRVQQVLLVRRTIFPVVEQGGEGIPGEEDVSVVTFAAFMNDINNLS